MAKTYKLKKKKMKVIKNLLLKLKSVGIDIGKILRNLMNNDVVSVSNEEIQKFEAKMIGEDAEKFAEMDDIKKKAIAGKEKSNREFTNLLVDMVEIIVENIDDIETEMDELLLAATNEDQSYLDELDIDEYILLIKEVVKANINFFNTSKNLAQSAS